MDYEDSFPSYHFPFSLLLELSLSLITNKHRSITTDAVRACRGISPPVRIHGKENIPDRGPALITMNHYAREGFFIIWAALAISAELPEDQLWLMTSAWTNREGGLDRLRTKLTRSLFKRVADIYGFITTPPLPPVHVEIIDRSASIRKVLQTIDSNPEIILCMAPEGRDFPPGELGYPAPGAGKFLFQLTRRLNRVVPVGVYEENNCLNLNFGTPFGKDELNQSDDEYVSHYVMKRIARLMPLQIRKIYPEIPNEK